MNEFKTPEMEREILCYIKGKGYEKFCNTGLTIEREFYQTHSEDFQIPTYWLYIVVWRKEEKFLFDYSQSEEWDGGCEYLDRVREATVTLPALIEALEQTI